jgi:predicted ArsR family transcriptional regulator
MMSGKELRRVHVLRQALELKITQGQAGEALGLTARPIRRLLERVQADGEVGLVHRGRGKPASRRMPTTIKVQALGLYARRHADFGPTLAAAKLAEHHGIMLSDETLRGWFRDAGIDHTERGGSGRRMWGNCSS